MGNSPEIDASREKECNSEIAQRLDDLIDKYGFSFGSSDYQINELSGRIYKTGGRTMEATFKDPQKGRDAISDIVIIMYTSPTYTLSEDRLAQERRDKERQFYSESKSWLDQPSVGHFNVPAVRSYNLPTNAQFPLFEYHEIEKYKNTYYFNKQGQGFKKDLSVKPVPVPGKENLVYDTPPRYVNLDPGENEEVLARIKQIYEEGFIVTTRSKLSPTRVQPYQPKPARTNFLQRFFRRNH